jgi:hypothetical protein
VVGHPLWGGSATLAQHIFFFWFFVFFLNKIYDKGILGKNVKVVELLQFESLGGLSVTFETLEVKVKMGG